MSCVHVTDLDTNFRLVARQRTKFFLVPPARCAIVLVLVKPILRYTATDSDTPCGKPMTNCGTWPGRHTQRRRRRRGCKVGAEKLLAKLFCIRQPARARLSTRERWRERERKARGQADSLHGNFLEAARPPARPPTRRRSPRGRRTCVASFSPSTVDADAADIGRRNESHLLGHGRREGERVEIVLFFSSFHFISLVRQISPDSASPRRDQGCMAFFTMRLI